MTKKRMNVRIRFKQHALVFLTMALTVYACQLTADNDSGNDFDLEKVAMCVACHGADGIGKAVQYPNLQGKPVDYIVSQLKFYKAGLRKNSTMNTVTKSLSEEDMRMLAVFFNQVK